MIKTMFSVQDHCRIRIDKKDIRVRYFLLPFEKLVESI
jgi:hypothetical protein